MDPTFAALLDQLRGYGFTDSMFGWLPTDNPAEWERRVRTITDWLTSGRYTADQINAMKNAGSFDEAASRLGAPGVGGPQTPPVVSVPANPADQTPAKSKDDGAFSIIRQMLNQMGLGSLADWAWKRYQEGASIDTIEIELYQRPEFKQQYPEYWDLAGRGRAVSVGWLQEYRRQVVGMLRSAGIPPGFYDDPAELARFASAEISLAEMSKRVTMAADAVYSSSPLFRAEMERLYGVSTGDLVAYFIDPDKAEPLIRQKYVASQIGAASRQTNYGTLTADEAERLYGQGVDAQRALEGFNTLARSQELFNPLAMSEQQIGRDVQLGAAFGGNAEAQQTVERRRGRRLAEFAKGGSYATNREGIAGI